MKNRNRGAARVPPPLEHKQSAPAAFSDSDLTHLASIFNSGRPLDSTMIREGLLLDLIATLQATRAALAKAEDSAPEVAGPSTERGKANTTPENP